MVFFDMFSTIGVYMILFFFSWIFFIVGNFLSIRVSNNSLIKFKKIEVIKHQFNFFVYNYSIVIVFYLLLSFYLEHGEENFIFSTHFYYTNSNSFVAMLAVLFILFLFLILKNTPITNIVVNNDYFFSLLNVVVVLPLLYYVNSFYSFFFIVELVSVLIFYKLSVSKFWFKQKNSTIKKDKLMEKIFSRSHTNALFFQYWVNFFSSILILFSIINMVSIYGSTEWFFLNLINFINRDVWYLSDIEYSVIFWIPLFFSLFFKIGVTPTHLFKIEVYRGIPLISIFFYTTYYFLIYFTVIVIILKNYLNNFFTVWWLFFFIFLTIGLIYSIFLLFDVFFTKAFFAYSTIVNGLGFLILVLASL